METENGSIPWVEKYRPNQFDKIVLDPNNQELFEKIIEKEYFPHLLFYGPPGTGKTTTIINLIHEYQRKHSRVNKENVIHLNASDERGIDIIRNQIYSFVKTKNLFEKGFKFVILDEVDYMTKNAQNALKYLLQTTTNDVRICLICNYISKIDNALKNEFMIVRFNQLPETKIFEFIKDIAQKEGIHIEDNAISEIQKNYCSDIRSMINYLQLNKDNLKREWNTKMSTMKIMEEIYNQFILKEDPQNIIQYIQKCSFEKNSDQLNIIQKYLNYIVRNHIELLNEDFFIMIENILHNKNCPINETLNYFVYSHSNLLPV
jgi:DNA polymerase III delta prime subunit|tara:strand:+ start:337 stop:1290 length:954 start_codon:yes stop_codon:yes gene_type:complete